MTFRFQFDIYLKNGFSSNSVHRHGEKKRKKIPLGPNPNTPTSVHMAATHGRNELSGSKEPLTMIPPVGAAITVPTVPSASPLLRHTVPEGQTYNTSGGTISLPQSR
jgi:hypothetical protein